MRDELLGRPAKDQDFVVPGVGYDELREALAPHGRVEDLEVAGRRVGLRLYPSDRALRSLAPAGIEFAPPRTERSTGPGRHDFEIVASPEISLEQDMARRDFTINAIAKRLETGELLDPFDGQEDLRGARAPDRLARELPRGSAAPRPRAPLRLRARPRPGRADARADARERRVGAPRLGGAHRRRAQQPTGWGSSRSCCSARIPPRRSGSRATRACFVELLPGARRRIDLTATIVSTAARRAHFAVVRPRRRRCAAPSARALLHDLGKVERRARARGCCAAICA